ncbi:MAG: FHA domain-containing protein [Planctomycetota bacterium]|nr:FHA domain-containing protein [Planctomycetota bacterium]
MLHAVLKVVGGKQDGKLIPLNTKKFLIGREQDCHLRPGSESVSRHHCAIAIDDFTVRVRDLGSSNGTYVNGKRIIGVHDANPGDALKIGSLEFEIIFSRSTVPAASSVSTKGGTSFSLDDFSLEEADQLSETAMIAGGDTAIIAASKIPSETVEQPADSTSAPVVDQQTTATEVPVTIEEPPASLATPTVPVENPVAAESPAPVPSSVEAPSPPDAVSPTPAMPQQAYPQSMPPGYQQPAGPMMPGYPQQMAPGYPYGIQQPMMPGYGMQQPMMPGYGMPQGGMPGYGMPQPGMPYPQYPGQQYPGQQYPGQQYPGQQYPGQQMQYPMAQQPVDEYDDDDDDDSEVETAKYVDPPVHLPDPSETGAVVEERTDNDDAAPKVEAPNPAADILKKYLSGR